MFELRAKSDNETEMLMYGSIREWGRVNAETFIGKIAETKSKGYEKIKLKINCPGGSIFEGLAILSQMSSPSLFIHGVVEGIAASMGAVILQGCDQRSMVKGTRMMIHQGASGVMGSANYIRNHADLLESLNKTLAEILAKRSKRDADYILKNWMPEGKDTWFTPEQALAEGLIDDIIEGNVKPLEKEQASLMEMAAHYNQFLDTTENAMDKATKEKLIKALGLTAEATDAQILEAVEKAKNKEEKTAEEKTAEAKKEKEKEDAKAESSTEKETLVEGVVALAKERGMTEESQINALKKLAQVDMKAAMDLIPKAKAPESSTTPGGSLNDLITAIKGGNGSSASDERKGWTLDDWQKKDSAGLMALAKDKPAEYAGLFKAKFGYAPTEDEILKLTL